MGRILGYLKNVNFWICVGSIVILNFISLYFVAGNIFVYKRSFINLFLIPKVYAANIVGFLFPIIPFLFIFSKRNKVETIQVKDCLEVASCAPMMLVFAHLLELLIYYVIDPSIKKLVFPPTGLFSAILEVNPFGYIFLYILHISAWGFVLIFFGMAVFGRTENKFYAVVMAFLLSRLSAYIPVIFGNIKIIGLEYIIPQLPFEISHMKDNWLSNLIQVIFLFVISIIILKNKEDNRKKEGCEDVL